VKKRKAAEEKLGGKHVKHQKEHFTIAGGIVMSGKQIPKYM
jgi:hypothetical protein